MEATYKFENAEVKIKEGISEVFGKYVVEIIIPRGEQSSKHSTLEYLHFTNNGYFPKRTELYARLLEEEQKNGAFEFLEIVKKIRKY